MIYTVGYGNDRTLFDLRELLVDAGAIGENGVANIIDCRLTRGSRNAVFRGANLLLASVAGFVYEWPHDDDSGKGLLGNAGGPGEWVPPWQPRADACVRAAAEAVHRGQTIVLLCAETKPMVGTKRECHRVKVAEAIAAAVPGECEVRHL